MTHDTVIFHLHVRVKTRSVRRAAATFKSRYGTEGRIEGFAVKMRSVLHDGFISLDILCTGQVG